MNFPDERSPIDGDFHRRALLVLAACSQANTLVGLTFRAPSIFDGSEYYYYFSGGPVLPRRTYIFSSAKNFLLVVLNGMENWDKVQACLTGWANPGSRLSGIYPFGSAGFNIWTELKNLPDFNNNTDVVVLGHSYGGAVAPWAADWIGQSVGVNNLMVYTYGAPKTNYNSRSGFLSSIPYRRVWHINDPVPGLPPTSEDLEKLWLLIGIPTARSWSRWLHPTSGYRMSQLNVLEPGTRPYIPLTWPGVWLSTIDLLKSSTMFGNSNHDLASYQYAMQTIPAAVQITREPAPQREPALPPVPPVRVLEERRDVALIMAAAEVAADPQAAAIGVQAGIPLIPGVRYRGGYAQGHPAVYYDGQVVLVVKTRRLRRAIVRQLNRSL
jgi:hypothetical protein